MNFGYDWAFARPVRKVHYNLTIAVLSDSSPSSSATSNSGGTPPPPAWRSATPLVHRARLGGAIAGMLFVLYLLYVELIELRQLCPYCTSIHVITFLLFSVIVFQASSPGALRGLRQARPAG